MPSSSVDRSSPQSTEKSPLKEHQLFHPIKWGVTELGGNLLGLCQYYCLVQNLRNVDTYHGNKKERTVNERESGPKEYSVYMHVSTTTRFSTTTTRPRIHKSCAKMAENSLYLTCSEVFRISAVKCATGTQWPAAKRYPLTLLASRVFNYCFLLLLSVLSLKFD